MKKTTANLPASVRQRFSNLATEHKEEFWTCLDPLWIVTIPISPQRFWPSRFVCPQGCAATVFDRFTLTTKQVRETEAEAVAFVVCQALGLETGTASAGLPPALARGRRSLTREPRSRSTNRSCNTRGYCPRAATIGAPGKRLLLRSVRNECSHRIDPDRPQRRNCHSDST